MALPAAFLDELRARTPLASLVGRRVRLQKSGRNSRGCCPFHNEKSPSFYVYEDGYHCFGCGAHGDAISFVMQTQGASFPEAVASLAAEAGIEIPRPSEAQARAERRRLDHHAVLEAAQAGFRRRLGEAEAAQARDYLARRGLSPATVEAWGLGWSGPGRGELARELAATGITPEMMAGAGLMRLDDQGGPAGELFFNRVTFPIRDGRGRIVAFGGRVLGDGQPKYLNGPETELFSKRRALFGLDVATAALRAGQNLAVRSLVVVEGYLDVIALHQAGCAAGVAPLGTALTEEQLVLAWNVSPMPVLCFDGDAAGGRAAARATDLALPLLTPERSLAIARMPPGEDPDSLARRDPRLLASLLAQPVPLATTLYELIRAETGEATPEARAQLRRRLQDAAGRIADRSMAGEFRSELLGRFFAARRSSGKPGGRFGATPSAVPRAAPAPRLPPDPARAQATRWDILLGLAVSCPSLLHDIHEALAMLPPPPSHARLTAAILDMPAHLVSELPLDTAQVVNHLGGLGLAEMAAQALRRVAQEVPAAASPAAAEETWWHFFGLMDPTRLDEDVEHARREYESRADESALRRLTALVRARAAIRRGETVLDDDT